MPKILLPATAVALALGLLGGCATAPSDPYRALPAVAPPETVALAHPAVPTGDAALDAFLADLAASIDRQAWRAVAQSFDPDAYTARYAAVRDGAASDEAAAVQVLTETLGLDLFETVPPSLAGLGRIRVVTFREAVRQPDGSARVTGDVRLDDGQAVPLSFGVRPGPPAYRVEVRGT